MIIYYSGTGNSEWVAKEMQRLTNDNNLVRLTADLPTTLTLEEGEPLGFIFPVHSWGLPKRVRSFMTQMKFNGFKRNTVYAIITCGDDCGLTNEQLNKLLKVRGMATPHIYAVRMPNTYIVFPKFDIDTPQLANEKITETSGWLPQIAEAVKQNKPLNHYVRTNASWLKSRVIYPLFMRHAMSDKPFYTTDACTGCGHCAEVCPELNIKIVDRRPVWQHHCTQCLGCINRCPQRAIEYGNRSLNKGRSNMEQQINALTK